MGRTKCAYRQINFSVLCSSSFANKTRVVLALANSFHHILPSFFSLFCLFKGRLWGTAKNLICFATELETFALSQSFFFPSTFPRFISWLLAISPLPETKQTSHTSSPFFFFPHKTQLFFASQTISSRVQRPFTFEFLSGQHEFLPDFGGIFHTGLDAILAQHKLKFRTGKKASKLIVFSLHAGSRLLFFCFLLAALPIPLGQSNNT